MCCASLVSTIQLCEATTRRGKRGRRLFDFNSSRRQFITREPKKGDATIMLGDLLMEVNGNMTSVSVGSPVPEGSRVDRGRLRNLR